MNKVEAKPQPWERLHALIEADDASGLAAAVAALPHEDTPYAVVRLGAKERIRLFEMLSEIDADLGADVMSQLADDEAARLLEDLEPADAAALVDEFDSDEQTDVLDRLDPDDQEAILRQMEPEEAHDSRERLRHDAESAGGLMITEYLAFQDRQRAADVVAHLGQHGDEYRNYEVRHLYVTDAKGRLRGVVPLRQIVMAHETEALRDLEISDPVSVSVDEELDDLEDLFDRIPFDAVPVVDDDGVLVGVLKRAGVQEALSERATASLLKFGGIIGGEESRSMPLANRTLRRLAFLLPNIVLSYAAVSIIAIYEPVIARMTALAVFIPMVANLSGAAGNQAVAVSIRELSLGTLRVGDVTRVWKKEVFLGAMNGLVIGAILGALVFITHADLPILALTIGVAYALNSILAVLIGGALPLTLTRIGVDPAMMSSPILTTLTDMGSFFLTLSFAAALLSTAPGT